MEDHSRQGAFSWNELLTSDVDAAKSFYTQLFGWDTQVMPSSMGDYVIFKVGDDQVGGMGQLPADAAAMGAGPYWGAYVSVDDVDAIAKKVIELGGRVLVEPMDIPEVGRFATFMDPQGAIISAITNASQG